MRHQLLWALALFFILPALTFAQGVPQDPAPEGAVDCFDYYDFGSVSVDLQPSLPQTIPGTPMPFKGEIINDNDYPLVDGGLYIKIFHKQPAERLEVQNGFELVDQYYVAEDLTIPANGSIPVEFTWNVPHFLESGTYRIATYFNTANRFNLSGRTFTDDIVGDTYTIAIGGGTDGSVRFDKNTVTLNGEDHYFANALDHFAKDEPVTAEATLVNDTQDEETVSVTWTLYPWDGLREDTVLDQETELVTLAAGEERRVSYTVLDTDHPVYFLVAEAQRNDAKSILDIRFVRNGVETTRINFPAVTSFPLTRGEETTLFSCVHKTSGGAPVPENTLTLTLTDEAGETIHQYTYEGSVTSAMMAAADTFTPTETIDTFDLIATLMTNGELVDEVTLRYDCTDIDPSTCGSEAAATGTDDDSRTLLAVLALVLAAVLLAAIIYWQKKGRRTEGEYEMSMPGDAPNTTQDDTTESARETQETMNDTAPSNTKQKKQQKGKNTKTPPTASLLALVFVAAALLLPGAVQAAAPNAPEIDGLPNGRTLVPYSFTFTATDPDGDAIYYEIDWNGDGTADERLPAFGTVASGEPARTVHSWVSSWGTQTFQARAIDATASGWTQHTINICSPNYAWKSSDSSFNTPVPGETEGSCVPAVDLVAGGTDLLGSPSAGWGPPVLTEGVEATLIGYSMNISWLIASHGFTNVMQYRYDGDADWNDVGTTRRWSHAPKNGSPVDRVFTEAYTFTPPRAGHVAFRYCVDYDDEIPEIAPDERVGTWDNCYENLGADVEPADTYNCLNPVVGSSVQTGRRTDGSADPDTEEEEAQDLSADTNWTYSDTDTAAKCEFTCPAGNEHTGPYEVRDVPLTDGGTFKACVPTACKDGVNNDDWASTYTEDYLVDNEDPGCWTDHYNQSTYDSDIGTERFAFEDIRASTLAYTESPYPDVPLFSPPPLIQGKEIILGSSVVSPDGDNHVVDPFKGIYQYKYGALGSWVTIGNITDNDPAQAQVGNRDWYIKYALFTPPMARDDLYFRYCADYIESWVGEEDWAAEPYGNTLESNESYEDNCEEIGPLSVGPSAAGPDLVPSLPTVSAPSVAQGGSIAFGTADITNTGGATAGPYTIGGFYIDNNADDVADYTEPAGDITVDTAPGASNATSGIVWNVPADAPVGTYRVSYTADVNDVIDEGTSGGEDNNTSGWTSFEVTAAALTQCDNDLDDEDVPDNLIDKDDPGCWTNITDSTTYDSSGDDEDDYWPNLRTFEVNVLGSLVEGTEADISASVVNDDYRNVVVYDVDYELSVKDYVGPQANIVDPNLDSDPSDWVYSPYVAPWLNTLEYRYGMVGSWTMVGSPVATDPKYDYAPEFGNDIDYFTPDYTFTPPSQGNNLYLRHCTDWVVDWAAQPYGNVAESNESFDFDNCMEIGPLPVGPAAATDPDLVSQSLSLSAGPYYEGTPIGLSAEVGNIGGADTPTGFSDNFSYQWNGTGGTWNDLPDIPKPALAVGDTSADNPNDNTDTYTPDQTGTLYIQHCVDSNLEIDEGANETPNCSVSAGVTVDAAPQAPSVSLNACDLGGGNCFTGTKEITTGEEVQLEWNSSNAVSCTELGGPNFSTGGATDGTDDTVTEPASEGSSIIFAVECENSIGVTDGDSVTVSIPAPGSPVLDASPSIVQYGDTATLEWDTGGIVGCDLTGPGFTQTDIAVTGTTDVTITSPSIFTIDCPVGSSDSVFIDLEPEIFES